MSRRSDATITFLIRHHSYATSLLRLSRYAWTGADAMARNRIQFQPGMSLSQFLELYSTEEQCEAALEKARWPNGFHCPRCGEQKYDIMRGRCHRRYQCRSCRYQTTVTAGTIMEATKLSLSKWFQAFYLVGEAKTGISSRSLKRKLGMNFRTAWLLHHKIRQAMGEG